jgi:hypothetical protein
MKKVLKAFAIAVTVVLALVSCKKEPTEVALTGIELNATTQELLVGGEFQLTVTYKPADATNKPAASWATDAPAIASVEAGKVKGLAAGTANITATVGKFTATCAITVKSAEEEIVPVEGTSAWSVIGKFLDSEWAKDYVCAEEDGAFVLKNVKLVKNNEIKFRKDKDWAVNRGINKENEAAELAAGTPTKAIQGGGNIIIPADGIYDLYYFAAKEAIVYVLKDATLPEIPDFSEPVVPEGLVIDGNAADWDNLEAADVVSLSLPADAAKTWLQSAKLYYDDKLYILLQVSDEAVASNKIRMHVYFDTDNSGKVSQSWSKPAIDYMTEGKINDGGVCRYSSTYYKWAGFKEDGSAWNWTDSGSSPTIESAGVANVYELSLTYDNFPGGLPVAFNIGVDVADGDYNITGFLPVEEKLARIVKVGEEDPGEEEVEEWDYTPSEEYLAEDNLWKAVDAANTVSWFYCPNWDWANQPAAPEVTFDQSTYSFTLIEADEAAEWTSQLWIDPTEDLLLDVTKKYTFTAKIYSSAGSNVYVKMYKNGVDVPFSFETAPTPNRIAIAAGETKEIKVEDFEPLATPQRLLIDFANHAANNTIHIKDITLKVTGEVPPDPDPVDWDYTPSEEYLADSNLWKPLDDGDFVGYTFMSMLGGWAPVHEPDNLTWNQSTREISLGETGSTWENQIFIHPLNDGHALAMDPAKTYRLKLTVGANNTYKTGFFKISKFNVDNTSTNEGEAIWEYGTVHFKNYEPTVIEQTITGKEADNIILVFGLGGNPADTIVYIKDIIFEEVQPAAGSDIPDYDPVTGFEW